MRDLQIVFGFEEPQAVYKWQSGKNLPGVDNLYALGVLLDGIIVSRTIHLNQYKTEQQAEACCSVLYWGYSCSFATHTAQRGSACISALICFFSGIFHQGQSSAVLR